MIKRYNFFLLLLTTLINFYITTKHVELHTVPVLYDQAQVFGMDIHYHVVSDTTIRCSTVYQCFRSICSILKNNLNVEYIGLHFNDRPKLCDDTISDLVSTISRSWLTVVIVSLIALSFLNLIITAIIVISVLIWRKCKHKQDFMSDIDPTIDIDRELYDMHWTQRLIDVLLLIGHILTALQAILILINTYMDMLPHMFYSTLWIQLCIIILQVIHITDKRYKTFLTSPPESSF
jgi:hypothetical protein